MTVDKSSIKNGDPIQEAARRILISVEKFRARYAKEKTNYKGRVLFICIGKGHSRLNPGPHFAVADLDLIASVGPEGAVAASELQKWSEVDDGNLPPGTPDHIAARSTPFTAIGLVHRLANQLLLRDKSGVLASPRVESRERIPMEELHRTHSGILRRGRVARRVLGDLYAAREAVSIRSLAGGDESTGGSRKRVSEALKRLDGLGLAASGPDGWALGPDAFA